MAKKIDPTKFSSGIEVFLNFISESETQYRMAEADLSEADAVLMDEMHKLELVDLSYHELAQAAGRIKQSRVLRRTAKDTMSQLQPIIDWSGENRPVIKKLEFVLGDMRKAEKNATGRFYTPRHVPAAQNKITPMAQKKGA